MNLTKNCKVVLAKATQTSAGTAVNSDGIDTAGYEGVVFFVALHTANASNNVKLQQSDDDGSTDDYTDIEGTKVTPGDSGDTGLVDLFRPRKRYVRMVITRSGANTVTGELYAILYGKRKGPVSHGSTIDSEVHISPAEGTA